MLDSDKYKYYYNWEIGIFTFKIYTSNSNLFMPFHYPKLINQDEKILITIYLNTDEREKEKNIVFCKQNAILYIPDELSIFYEGINKVCNKNFSLENHVNKYYKYKDILFAHFPYVTDNFLIKYSQDYDIIEIYGNENNLYRVMVDFLTISEKILPLHASSVSKYNNSFSFLGESGGGKTSFLIKLLENRYDFLADDSLFVRDDKLIPVNYELSVRRKYPNHPEIRKIVNNHIEEKILINIERELSSISLSKEVDVRNNYFFGILGNDENWNSLVNMEEPFPCIAHHSFWATKFLVKKNIKFWINEKILTSLRYWNNISKNIKFFKIDFNRFEDEVEEFDNYIKKVVL